LAILKGDNYVIDFANTHICDLWGRKEKQILGQPLFDVLPEMKDSGFDEIFETVIKTGKSSTGKEIFIRLARYGKTENVYFDFVYEPLRSHDGTIEGIIISARDVTERVESRLKIKDSELRYKTLFSSMDEGFAIVEMIFDTNEKPIDYFHLEVNPAFEIQMRVTGVKTRRVREIDPNVDQHWLDILGKVAVTGESTRFEHRASYINRWFEVYAFAMGVPGSLHVGFVFNDITVRKLAEANIQELNKGLEFKVRERTAQLGEKVWELKQAIARDQAILSSIGEAIVVVDDVGDITYVNKVFEELLGWKKEEVLGRNVTEVIPHEYENGSFVPPEERPLARVLKGEKIPTSISALPSVYFPIRRDGTRFPVASVVTPITLGKTITGAVAVFRDITLERGIDKAKSEFVSLASHQLRTPTTSINWYSEMLLEGEVGILNKKQKEYCNEIHRGNQRMIALMNELLAVSRVELSTLSIDPTPINVLDIANDVVDELSSQIVKKRLQIEKKYDSHGGWIMSDSTLVRIMIQNLLANAVMYSLASETITISIKKDILGVHVEVMDTGCGIPENIQSKIFVKFFRAENAKELRPDGTGLGLYMTKSIAEALKGTINFTSQENKGAIFTVLVPDYVVQPEQLIIR
jgi:PAS domain S-box-containing protein